MSSGPPPVPGGRSPEEREAARREREARRTGRPPVQVAAAPPREDNRDWLAEAQTLTTDAPAKPASGRRGPRWGRLIALGILLAIVVGIAWFANALFQPFADDGGEPVRVTIPQGSSLSQIADILEREGVVANAGFFQLRARIEGHSGDLRPGSYELKEDMSFSAALTALQEGVPPDVVQVAIPEGLSRREIRPLTKGLRGNYVRASRRSPALHPRDYRAPRGATLEGSLFPATYELKKGRRVNALISEQLNHFKRNFDKVDLSFAKRKNLTAYDVLIIASLIDREAMMSTSYAVRFLRFA